MPRMTNPYSNSDAAYSDVAQNLGTALFGNPDLAAKQQAVRAQMENNQATADYRRAQTTGENIKNIGLEGLTSDAFQNMMTVGPDGKPQLNNAGLSSLMASLAQSGNEDFGKNLGAAAAFFAPGNDTVGRTALIARGSSPSNGFATTAGRADDIANRDAGNSLAQAMGVAGVQADTSRANNTADNDTRVLMNTADNARALSANSADNTSKETIASGKLLPGGKPPPRFPASQLGNIDAEINAQVGGSAALDRDLQTLVRSRAIELTQENGNPAASVQQALGELVEKKDNYGFFGSRPPTYTPRTNSLPAQPATNPPENLIIHYDVNGNRVQ